MKMKRLPKDVMLCGHIENPRICMGPIQISISMDIAFTREILYEEGFLMSKKLVELIKKAKRYNKILN